MNCPIDETRVLSDWGYCRDCGREWDTNNPKIKAALERFAYELKQAKSKRDSRIEEANNTYHFISDRLKAELKVSYARDSEDKTFD